MKVRRMKVFIILLIHLVGFSSPSLAGKCWSKPKSDEDRNEVVIQRPIVQNQIPLQVEEYNGTDIMIVGGTYSQTSYKTINRINSPYFLTDVSNDPSDLKHDVTKPFPEKYNGKFKIVVFEQLPYFVINQQSISNVLNVLKPTGHISMNCPFSLQEMNHDFDGKEADYTLLDNRKVWKQSAFIALKNSSLEKFKPRAYQGEDYSDILKFVVPRIFNNECALDQQKVTVVQYNNDLHKNQVWFKNNAPNPPYLVIIGK
jgi:hypothetical protein